MKLSRPDVQIREIVFAIAREDEVPMTVQAAITGHLSLSSEPRWRDFVFMFMEFCFVDVMRFYGDARVECGQCRSLTDHR